MIKDYFKGFLFVGLLFIALIRVYCWTLADFLNTVDLTLFERMEYETQDQNASVILYYLKLYNTNFVELIQKVEERRVYSDEAARTLMKHNGPKFAYIKLFEANDLAKTLRKWKPYEVDQLKKMLNETKELWGKFKTVSSYVDMSVIDKSKDKK